MRLKVILCALALALGMIAPAVYFRLKPIPMPVAAQPVAVEASAPAVMAPPAAPSVLQRVSGPGQKHAHDGVDTDTDPGENATPAEHDAYVQKREATLYSLGRSRDPAALQSILADVHNKDPQIRSAALTAAMDYGNSNAIPTLKNEMGWTDDLHDKMQIQKAIDYLEIPPASFDAQNRILPTAGDP